MYLIHIYYNANKHTPKYYLEAQWLRKSTKSGDHSSSSPIQLMIPNWTQPYQKYLMHFRSAQQGI